MTIYKALCVELLREWDNAPTPSDIIDTEAFGVIRKIRTTLETEETMTNNHPITPPPELLQQWAADYWGNPGESIGEGEKYIATQAARWGADKELKACCEYLSRCAGWELEDVKEFSDFRRPEPPSLKEQALSELAGAVAGGNITPERGALIRLALEQLDD